MEILELLYEEEQKNSLFFDRKTTINAKKTLLKGCRRSGKTTLILDHLSAYNNEEYLYIDLHDERIKNLSFISNLQKFINSKNLRLLVIENYDFSFSLPICDEIILSISSLHVSVKDFEDLILYPVDFEEFIAFDRRHFNIEHLFNLFANQGTFPQIVLTNEIDSKKELQNLIKLILPNQTKFSIYKKLVELQSTKISLFQIYNQLKSSIKISKDKLYEYVAQLQEEGLLYLIEKHASPKSNKKVYLCDFAIKNALSLKKDFLKRFENIVFSELYKKYQKIYYTDFIDFYLPNENLGVICAPFSLRQSIITKLEKKSQLLDKYNLKHIEIVSIGNEDSFSFKELTCNVIPFWEWALQR
jgi:uncharacterized protein